MERDQAQECFGLIRERFNDRDDLLTNYATEQVYLDFLTEQHYDDVLAAIYSAPEGTTLPPLVKLEARIIKISKTENGVHTPPSIDAKANAARFLKEARAHLVKEPQ